MQKYFLGKEVIMRLFSSWLMAALFLTIGIEDFLNLDFCRQDILGKFVLYGVGAFVVLTVLRMVVSIWNDDIFLLVATMLYALRVLKGNWDVYFLLGVALFVSMIYIYCYSNIHHLFQKVPMSNKQMWYLIGGVAVIVTVFVGRITIARHLLYVTSNYDMGIFVQTFYNLRAHLTMNNTCERNCAISHLQVHTSLFYYVLAPFYWLVPKAETLLVIQVVAVALGVIPLTLLVKHLGLSNKVVIGIAMVYLFSLGVWGGCFYDFHENVFLLPLLLWCFYCYETKKTKLLFVAAFAVCTVKEDAPFYIFIFALYILFSQGKKEWKKGIGLMALAGVYMVCAFAYLDRYGLGLMTERFHNLMTDDSLFSMLKVIFTNPAYIFAQSFNVDKLLFMIVVFLPIIAVLVSTKKYHHFVLVIPVFFMNLIPDYEYMHSIFFQYVFGSIAFLMYLFVLNIVDVKKEKRAEMIGLAVCLAMLTFTSQIQIKKGYLDDYKEKTEMRETVMEAFELIPDDASVTADTYFVPHLANREEIYMLEQSEVEQGIVYDTDYVIFDIREGCTMGNYVDAINLYSFHGYEEVYRGEGNVLLLKRAAE